MLKIDEGVKYTMSETLLAIESNKRLLAQINVDKEILTKEQQDLANIAGFENRILENIALLEKQLVILNVPNE